MVACRVGSVGHTISLSMSCCIQLFLSWGFELFFFVCVWFCCCFGFFSFFTLEVSDLGGTKLAWQGRLCLEMLL